MSTSIIKPPHHTYGATPVRDPQAIGSGEICAEGVADQSGGADPTEVWGKIIPLAGAVPPLDGTWTQGDWVPYTIRRWRISSSEHGNIPNAQCAAPPNPPLRNRLGIWLVYPGGQVSRDHEFDGVRANETECDRTFEQYAALAAVPAEAPQEMQVDAAGFTGEKVETFNGAWALKAKKGARCVWNNGRDRKKPRVELLLNLEAPHLWQLTFQLGRTKLVFHQSNLNWSWSRANELLYTGGNAKRKGAPMCVRVSPICCG